jgi:hypothetical protein
MAGLVGNHVRLLTRVPMITCSPGIRQAVVMSNMSKANSANDKWRGSQQKKYSLS